MVMGGDGTPSLKATPDGIVHKMAGRFSLRPPLPAHLDARGCAATYVSLGYKHIALLAIRGGVGQLPSVQDNIFILQHVRFHKMGGLGWGDW